MSKKNINKTEQVYKVLREFGGTISVRDIATLLGWEPNKKSVGEVKMALLNIKRKGIILKNKRGLGYKLVSTPENIVFTKRWANLETAIAPTTSKQVSTDSNKPAVPVYPLDDKCYFLIKAYAGKSVTSTMVSDFFGVDDEAAICMLNRVCKRYRDTKCTITAVAL